MGRKWQFLDETVGRQCVLYRVKTRQPRKEEGKIDEKEILDLLYRDREEGLEALMDQYIPYVSAIASRILPGDLQDREEVVTDVFFSAWKERKKLRPGKVKGWLSVVTRNKALNLLRSQRRILPFEEDVLLLAGDGPHRELERQEAAQLVRRAMQSLSEEDRELFVRHYFYGQTVQKAAEDMEMNLSTAKTRLKRGREQLKEELRKAGYEIEGT